MSDKTIPNIPPENPDRDRFTENPDKINELNCSIIEIENYPIYRDKLDSYLQEVPLNCFQEQRVAFMDDCFVSTPCNVYVQNYMVVNKKINSIEFSDNFSSASTEGKEMIKEKIENLISSQIDFEYPILKNRPLVLTLPLENGLKGMWQIETIDIIKSLNKFILVGKPGSGKTILARRFALELLDDPKYFPVYIDLKDYFLINSSITLADISLYISSKYGLNKDDLYQLFICNKNSIYYILDGVDEIYNPETNNKIIWQRLNRFVNNQVNILLTSREKYSGLLEFSSFPLISTQPLLHHHVYDLFIKYFEGENSDNSFNQFYKQISSIPIELRERPLFIVLLTFLFNKTGQIPRNKIVIFEEFIDLLLFQWKPQIKDIIPKNLKLEDFKIRLIEVLEKVSFSVITQGRISREEFGTFLNDSGISNEYHTKVISYLISKAGIIESQNDGFGFIHRSFAEYLAGNSIAKKLEYSEDIYTKIEHSLDAFKEPILYVGDILRHKKKIPVLRDFLTNLLEMQSKPNWTLWLVSQVYHPEYFNTNGFFNKNLLSTIVAHIQKQNDLPSKCQVDIANLLGLVGDKRKGVGCNSDGQPDILWVKVDEGLFTCGLNSEHEKILMQKGVENYNRDSEYKEISVKEFSISKYLITVLQFKAFLKEEYLNSIWWNYSEESKDWFTKNSKIRHEEIEKYNLDTLENHPITHITWFEAKAYCNWLSSKFNAYIDLPTAVQWEKACKALGNFIFPWGNSFSSQSCNTVESNIKGTSPVGCFNEVNDSPLDMIENVWEWCLDKEKNKRIVKGGSFYNKSYSIVRSTFCGRDYPDLSTDRQGFRIVQNKEPIEVISSPVNFKPQQYTHPQSLANIKNVEVLDYKRNNGKVVEEHCYLNLKYSIATNHEDLIKEVNLIQSKSNLGVHVSKDYLNNIIFDILMCMTETETITFKVNSQIFTNNNNYNNLIDLDQDLFIECHINSID